MKNGVYAKKDYEIIVTNLFKIIFYNKDNYFGCQIYKEDNLTCVIELDKFEGLVRYAYRKNDNKIMFNDIHLTSFLDFTYFEMDIDALSLIDSYEVTNDSELITNFGIDFNNENDFDLHVLTSKIKCDIEIKKGEVYLISSPCKFVNSDAMINCYQPYIRIEKDKIPICNINSQLEYSDEIYKSHSINKNTNLLEKIIMK